MFVIGLVADVPENYVNVKRLWLRYTVATVLKLCNILVGMMSHSSSHPCCWCDTHKSNLKNKGNQRTITSLMALFWHFFDARADKKDAKMLAKLFIHLFSMLMIGI